MSIRIKFVGDKLAGYMPAGRQFPDYKTIVSDLELPDGFAFRDNYGNLQYEIEVTEKTVTDDMGERIEKQVQVIKKRMMPTAEQKTAYRKKRIVEEINKKYDINDELAILFHGSTGEIASHNGYVDECKIKIDKEIEKDLKEI